MRGWNQIYFSFDDWFKLVLIPEMLISSNYLLKMLKEFYKEKFVTFFCFQVFILFTYGQMHERDIIGIKFVLTTDSVECFSRPNIFSTSLENNLSNSVSQKLDFGKQLNEWEN